MSSDKNSPSAFPVFVMNLCAADFLMGVYMAIIGTADAIFHGRYVQEDRRWRQSAACKVAGVLGLMSSEMSALVICLITLDRLLVICLPLKAHLHLTRRTAIVGCLCCWLGCLLLAVAPLPLQLQFYDQNAICLPLPITRQQYSGQAFSFAVFIVTNFVLFLFVGCGQLVIYRAVRAAGLKAGTQRRQQDLTIARRLFLVAFTDFCCWFPVGLMGLLAAGGVSIPGEVNVWTAIFVLPLNSALNPFLYTLNRLMEKWEKMRMEARNKRMLQRLQTEIPKWQPSAVEEMMLVCIRSKLVSTEKILRWVGAGPSTSTSTPQSSDCKAGHLNAPKLAGADGGGDDVVGVYGGSGGGPTEGGGIVVEVNEFPSGVSTEITGCDQEPTK